jgi:hypothetical protein
MGETPDLDKVLDNPLLMRIIRLHRATHICVHDSSGDSEQRQTERKDLIEYWQPPCNV